MLFRLIASTLLVFLLLTSFAFAEVMPPQFEGGRDLGTFRTEKTVTTVIAGVNVDDYNNYLKKLEANGYEKYSENAIGPNLFALYTNENMAVNVTFTKNSRRVHITTEPRTYLPSLKAPEFDKVQEPLLIQIEHISVDIQEGMSYALMLSDGSFIMIDGAWHEQNYIQADRLYETLRNYTSEKIKIAAWILTHAHGDHIGCFSDFIEKYKDEIEVEMLIYNFPHAEDIKYSDSPYMLNNEKGRLQVFNRNIEKYLPDTIISTPHSGYKYYIRDAVVQVFATVEDMFPTTIRQAGMNSSCTIFQVELGNQTIMFLGDSGVTQSNYVANKYGSLLKSDMMQVSHHGYGGGTVALYRNINPTVALWPVSISTISPGINNSDNQFLVNNPDTKEIIISAYGTRALELPYTAPDLGNGMSKISKATNLIEDTTPLTEPERPSEDVTVPDPYFDLSFVDGGVKDRMNNVRFNIKGGSVQEVDVNYKGKTYTTTGYRATTSGHYIEVILEEITSSQMLGDLLLGGCTFEMFVQLDYPPMSTVGFLTSCYSGGVTLYLRGLRAQMNFQIGSTRPNAISNINYSMVQPNSYSSGAAIDGGRVAHVVGTYDKETNLLNLYYNGVLVASYTFGDGEFEIGNAIYNKLGIGRNVSYMSESLAEQTPYTVLRSRVYFETLSATQVAAEYYDCIDTLVSGQQ